MCNKGGADNGEGKASSRTNVYSFKGMGMDTAFMFIRLAQLRLRSEA